MILWTVALGLFGGLCILALVAGLVLKAKVEIVLAEAYAPTDPEEG